MIGGVECKIHFFVMSLPHSDAVFVKGYPAETTEAFCDGHVSAFAFFGGIPQSILYDNTQLLDTALPTSGRLFPYLTVDKVVKRYAYLRRLHPELHGTVFHSTRKWFITQCERTGVPEHFTATLVGHRSARSANKLTYGLYSAGISDEQKRGIVEGVRAPEG